MIPVLELKIHKLFSFFGLPVTFFFNQSVSELNWVIVISITLDQWYIYIFKLCTKKILKINWLFHIVLLYLECQLRKLGILLLMNLLYKANVLGFFYIHQQVWRTKCTWEIIQNHFFVGRAKFWEKNIKIDYLFWGFCWK